MKIKFIEDTKNIQSLKEAMAALQARNNDLPGLGLISGQAGLGKTQAVKWYATQHGCPYIRAIATWTPRTMLQDICVELGQDPEYRTAAVFRQVVSELHNPQLIFVDEADYLTANWKLLETLRDVHDLSGSPFVIIGMGNIKNRLAKRHQFWSRISQIVEFKPLTAKEVMFIAGELTGLDTPDNVAEQITKATGGFFRDVMVALSHIERIAKTNDRKTINPQMVTMTTKAVLKQRAA